MHSARTESEASSWLETGSEDTAESEYEYYWSKSGTGWVMTQSNEYNSKGQLISKCLFGVIVWTKKPTKNLTISALEFKKWWNQQNKGTFL